MNEHLYPQWQPALQAALTEFDPTALKEKVLQAEYAIFVRLQELSGSADHKDERLSLEDAKRILLVLKQQKLNYPSTH